MDIGRKQDVQHAHPDIRHWIQCTGKQGHAKTRIVSSRFCSPACWLAYYRFHTRNSSKQQGYLTILWSCWFRVITGKKFFQPAATRFHDPCVSYTYFTGDRSVV